MKNLLIALSFLLIIGCTQTNNSPRQEELKETKVIGIYSESQNQLYKLAILPNGGIEFGAWAAKVPIADGECDGHSCGDCDRSYIMTNGVTIYCKTKNIGCDCIDVTDAFGRTKTIQVKTCDCDLDPSYPDSDDGNDNGNGLLPEDWIMLP